jgi:MFS family permease
MDRSGAAPVVTTGVCVMICAWLAFGVSAASIAFVVAGAVMLDCGLRTAMVANQTLVNSAVKDSRGRANTIFGMHVWCGNAVGGIPCQHRVCAVRLAGGMRDCDDSFYLCIIDPVGHRARG